MIDFLTDFLYLFFQMLPIWSLIWLIVDLFRLNKYIKVGNVQNKALIVQIIVLTALFICGIFLLSTKMI